jgi:hypothetical protein
MSQQSLFEKERNMTSEIIKPTEVEQNDIVLKSLPHKELIIASNNALERCDHAMQIWTHSRSGIMLRNMTVGSHPTPLRQMRQVAAELQKKKMAMIEAKFNVMKKRKEAKIKRQEAENEKDQLRKDYLLIEAQELEETSCMVEQPYLGAMREVVELSRIHDSLETQIREKYGKFDEEVFEIEEAKYWVQRAFAQSLRDIRQSRVISSGNQELLEQIGLNPGTVKKILCAFLESIEKADHVSNQPIEDFIRDCSEEYYLASSERIRRFGLPDVSDQMSLLVEYTNEETK